MVSQLELERQSWRKVAEDRPLWRKITQHKPLSAEDKATIEKADREARPFACLHCSARYSTQAHLTMHHQREHAGESVPQKVEDIRLCPKCNRACKGQMGLPQHMRISHAEEQKKCPNCGVMISAERMDQHMEVCNRRKLKEKESEEAKKKEEECECQYCHQSWPTVRGRDVHRRKCPLNPECPPLPEQDPKQFPFQCDACGKRFTELPNMQKHQRENCTIHRLRQKDRAV